SLWPEFTAKFVVQMGIARQVVSEAEPAESFPVPVARPVVDIAGHVVTAIGTYAIQIEADRRGPADPGIEVDNVGGGPVIAPRIAPAIGAAGRLLPLGIGGQTPSGPAGVSIGFKPADAGHGLIRTIPTGLAPQG